MPSVHLVARHANFSDASKHKKRPFYFDRKLCHQNLLSTSTKLASITYLVDTFYEKKNRHFIFQEKRGNSIEIQQGTEAGAFLQLLQYLQSRKFSEEDIIYIVEDDYIHRPNWQEVLLEAFTITKADYVTLYDHKDKYFFPQYEKLQSKIFAGKLAHYRTTPSTTNTFAVKWKTLQEDLSIHESFSQGCKITKDHEKFVALQAKNRLLVSSIPGWSTHVESDFLSPCIDWKKVLYATTEKKPTLSKRLFIRNCYRSAQDFS